MIKNNINSLYIHIPFCNHICTYCDFYKMIANEKTKEKYINYLIKELYLKKDNLSQIQTVYIGGGSPSSLPLFLLENLLKTLAKFLNLKELKEFTIEANPNDINLEFLNLIKKYQISRISLGVQSILDNKLQILGRTHNKNEVFKTVMMIKDSGIDNINVDYIYGVSDTIESVKIELDFLLSLPITHISTYSLILEEHTILYNKYLKNEFSPMNEDLESSIYYFICEYLRKKGFIHYEISNFSLPKYQSLHNLCYWDNNHYEAIGAYASSYIDNIRSTNINNLEKYYYGIDNNELQFLNYEILSEQDQIEDEFMLGLRKIEGVNLQKFQEKFNKDPFKLYPIIKELIEKGFLKFENNFLFIPENKLYISNSIILYFIS